MSAWDGVQLEHRLTHADAVRVPDIVLTRQGVPVGAIEVFVTHAVPPEKEATLAAMGVPWLEVVGDATLFTGPEPWSMATALPVWREGGIRSWRCAAHEWAVAARQAEAERQAAEARELARHSSRVVAAKVLDIFYPSGKWFRRIYTVTERRRDGHVVRLELGHEGSVLRSVPVSPNGAHSRTAASRTLIAVFERDRDRLATREGVIVDSPMEWARGPLAVALVNGAEWDTGPRDGRPLHTRYPRRWVLTRDGRWWLPPDMASVSWERPEHDTFEAHPASVRRRQAARSLASAHGGKETVHAAAVSRSSPRIATPRRSGVGARPPKAPSLPVVASPDDFGAAVTRVTRTGAFDLLELDVDRGVPPRALLVMSSLPTPGLVDEVAATLAAARTETVWLGSPHFWSDRFIAHAWLPLVRAADGRLNVVLDGRPLSPQQFAAEFAGGSSGFSLDAIREAGSTVAARLRVTHAGADRRESNSDVIGRE